MSALSMPGSIFTDLGIDLDQSWEPEQVPSSRPPVAPQTEPSDFDIAHGKNTLSALNKRLRESTIGANFDARRPVVWRQGPQCKRPPTDLLVEIPRWIKHGVLRVQVRALLLHLMNNISCAEVQPHLRPVLSVLVAEGKVLVQSGKYRHAFQLWVSMCDALYRGVSPV